MNKMTNENLYKVESLILKSDDLLSKKENINKKQYYENLIQSYKKLITSSKKDDNMDTIYLMEHMIEKALMIGNYDVLISFLNDYGYDDTVIQALIFSNEVLKKTTLNKNKKVFIDNIIEHTNYDKYIDKNSTDNNIERIILLLNLSEILYIDGYKDKAQKNIQKLLDLFTNKSTEKLFHYDNRLEVLSTLSKSLFNYDEKIQKASAEILFNRVINIDEGNVIMSSCYMLFTKHIDFQKLSNFLTSKSDDHHLIIDYIEPV